MCITVIILLKAQRIQLEQEAKEKNENLQKKNYARNNNSWAAMKSNTKRLRGEELKLLYLKNVLMYSLPESESCDKPYIYTKGNSN